MSRANLTEYFRTKVHEAGGAVLYINRDVDAHAPTFAVAFSGIQQLVEVNPAELSDEQREAFHTLNHGGFTIFHMQTREEIDEMVEQCQMMMGAADALQSAMDEEAAA